MPLGTQLNVRRRVTPKLCTSAEAVVKEDRELGSRSTVKYNKTKSPVTEGLFADHDPNPASLPVHAFFPYLTAEFFNSGECF